MICGSVCSGIAADSVAWKPLGWKTAWFAEIGDFQSAVLAYRYPEICNLGDFTAIGQESGPIGLLFGGTPCQDFSLAGLGAGLDGDRGNLTLQFLRLAERLSPRWVAWENVPGVMSNKGGRAFGTFLGGLAKLGYGWAYRVLDAQYFGCPMSRRRVFVVGYLGDWRRSASVLFERSCVSVGPRFHEQGEAFSSYRTKKRPDGKGRTVVFTDRKREGGRSLEWRIERSFTPLVRKAGGSRTARQLLTPEGELRTLTPRETERMFGFPDDWTLVPYRGDWALQGHRNEALGNTIAVPVLSWLGQRIDIVDQIESRQGPTP